MKITVHMLIKNEENWVWFAIKSVLPYVNQVIIFDTGSTDKTLGIINHLIRTEPPKQAAKILLKKQIATSRKDLAILRQKMVDMTKTEWFLLVDGDEVWSASALEKLLNHLKRAPDEIRGVVVRTRNCVGDIYHYQPESAGNYRLKGRKGHLTIRAYRKHPDYKWQGEYPLEGFVHKSGRLLNDQAEALLFVDTYYYHLTHLKRSNPTDSASVIDRVKKYKREIGIKAKPSEQPEVFAQPYPDNVPNPFTSYTWSDYIVASIMTPFKQIKRLVKSA